MRTIYLSCKFGNISAAATPATGNLDLLNKDLGVIHQSVEAQDALVSTIFS